MRLYTAIVFVLTSVLQFLPLPWGVSPIGAYALYNGARHRFWLALSLTVVPVVIAHLVFGWFDPLVMLCVYAGFGLATLPGRWLLSRQRSYRRYGGAVVLGAVIFFLLSNFGVWAAGYYPATLAGLATCYFMGLPFLGYALLGDALFCFAFFGAERLQLNQYRSAASH